MNELLSFVEVKDMQVDPIGGMSAEEAREGLLKLPSSGCLPTLKRDGKPGALNQWSLRLQITAGYSVILVRMV